MKQTGCEGANETLRTPSPKSQMFPLPKCWNHRALGISKPGIPRLGGILKRVPQTCHFHRQGTDLLRKQRKGLGPEWVGDGTWADAQLSPKRVIQRMDLSLLPEPTELPSNSVKMSDPDNSWGKEGCYV